MKSIPLIVYRVRVNVEGGIFYYVGEAYASQNDAIAEASALHDAAPYPLRKRLGIVGITVEAIKVVGA